MANPFAGKVAVVTGAASGIGRAVSEQLLTRGARVVMADLNEPLLNQVVDELRAGGAPAEGVTLNVTSAEAVAEAVTGAKDRHGRLDFLFNNAGIATVGEVRDMGPRDWQRVFDINVFGVLNGVRVAYPLMIEQGFGHIVNTASIAGLIPSPGVVAYAATKHAVVGLSNGLRVEAAVYGVRVSVVCPGVIDTPIIQNADLVKVEREEIAEKTPFKAYPVDACARDILRGVARDRGVIVVSPHGKLIWRMFRFFPGLVHRFALREFRRSRLTRTE